MHGAWHGGWCWRRVVDRLEGKGHYVLAPTLSGVGERSHLAGNAIDLTTQVNDIVNEIRWKDLNEIALVGHSYGGCVITGVAEQLRDRIAAIVYLDAFMPEDGESLSDMLGDRAPPWPEHLAPPIPAEVFKVNAADVAFVNAKMTPHPVRCFTEKLKVTGAYQTVAKKLYVRALDFDNPPFDEALARCQSDTSWRTVPLRCGHDVMLDRPAELAALLAKLA